MTLDEAIRRERHAMRQTTGERSEEHRQMAEWLKELADEQRKVLILMTEVNSLRAENDELKRSAKLDDSTIGTLNACIDDLNAENFKLRKLVRDMWDVALHPETFGDGSYLLRRMLELGIET